MSNATDTAHEAWDKSWSSADGREPWVVPEPDVVSALSRLRLAGAKTALDLGCGVGRHALAMAALGFETTALDASESGLSHLSGEAKRLGLTVKTVQGKMDRLPFDDGSFDLVVSWNVLYHGDPDIVNAAIAEIARVMAPGGTLLLTMLSKRRSDFGAGTEIAPDTFVNPAAGGDKGHPHFFCDAAGLLKLLQGFEVLDLKDVDTNCGDWHWHVVAERFQ